VESYLDLIDDREIIPYFFYFSKNKIVAKKDAIAYDKPSSH